MDERAARARGDVVRGAAAPMAGALAGGLGALLFTDAPQRMASFARDAWSSSAQLDDARSLLTSLATPVLVGALLGALALGFLQTRGYVGWTRASPDTIERSPASRAVTLVAWALLLVVVLQTARVLLSLHGAAAPLTIAVAAQHALGRSLRGVVIAVLALALADHLLRARARTARLTTDDAPVRRAAYPVVQPDPAWLTATRMVLFEGERAIAIDMNSVLLARGVGLAALALREAARASGKRVRSVQNLAPLDSVEIGARLPAEWRG